MSKPYPAMTNAKSPRGVNLGGFLFMGRTTAEPVSNIIASDGRIHHGAYGTSRRLPACILAGVRWPKAMV
jgi:hypothetical protein